MESADAFEAPQPIGPAEHEGRDVLGLAPHHGVEFGFLDADDPRPRRVHPERAPVVFEQAENDGIGKPLLGRDALERPVAEPREPAAARAYPQHARPVDVEGTDGVGGQPVGRGERRERAVAVAAQSGVGAAEPERAVGAFGEGDDQPVRQPIGRDGLEPRAGPPGEALSARPHAALPVGEEAEYDVAGKPVGSRERREPALSEAPRTAAVRPDPERAVGVFGEGEHALGR